MPSKNKPKRFDRNRKFQVARRKLKQKRYIEGKGRNRKPRDKDGKVIGSIAEKDVSVVKTVKKKEITKEKSAPKKVKDVPKKEEGDKNDD